MQARHTSLDNPARLAVLQDCGLLDSPPEEAFDRLTRLARRLLGVPLALVSLVDDEGQFFKSCAGDLPEPWASRRQTPLSHSFCQYVVSDGQPVAVADARLDPRLADNPAIPDLGVVAYAGIPLCTRDGYVLGSFCAVDAEPRAWSAADLALLADIAAAANAEIELRLDTAREARLRLEIEGEATRFRGILESLQEIVFQADITGQWTYLNPAWSTVLHREPAACVGRSILEFVHTGDHEAVAAAILPVVRHEQPGAGAVVRFLRADGQERLCEVTIRPLLGPSSQLCGLTGVISDITERQDNLDRREELFRAMCDEAPAILWTEDATGHRTFASHAWSDLVGAAVDGHAGDRWTDFVHPDELPRLLAVRQEALTATIPYEVAYRVRATGGYCWMLDRATPRFDAPGVIAGWIGACVDITPYKQTQAALAESEARFRELFDRSSDGIAEFRLDAGGFFRFERVNPTALAALGRPLASVLGRTPGESICPTHAEFIEEALQRCLAARTTVSSEDRLDLATGRSRVLSNHVTPLFAADGAIRGALFVSRDITSRRRAESARDERQQWLDALVEHSPVAIQVFRPDGVLVRQNAACGPAFAATPEELHAALGRFNILTDAFTRSAGYADDLRRAFAGEVVDLRNVEMDFGAHPNRWTCYRGRMILDRLFFPIHEAAGGISAVVSLSRDVTEHRLMEEAMHHAQKVESIAALAGGVAHDFDNILVGVMGNAGLALRECPPGSVLATYLHDIETAAQRAGDLAQQLLAYAGRGKILVEPVGLSAMLSELGPLAAASVGRHIAIDWDLAEGLPPIEADLSQLRQLVVNLLINASEAIGDAAGRIHVRTGAAPGGIPADTPGATAAAGPAVFLEVADNGAGMDEATRARIFDPFFTTKFTGRGLGLSAVLGIVRGHHGSITVQSEPGAGARIRILFPATSPSALPLAPRPPAPETATGAILVVDDEEAVRVLTSRALSRLGFDVVTAADGLEGEEAFHGRRGGFDCILLDLTMPRRGGQDTMRALRAARPDARIVIMSGYSESEILPGFAAERPDGFLQKPFGITALRDMVLGVTARAA